ncbi:MAG: hypothetical protein KBD67_06905 [Anaerolineaceae bacterium]|nr:hypothetical protein [Anaerolineaceae bacterium]
MEQIKEFLIGTFDQIKSRPLYAAITGFVIGLIIGLPVLGWGLWPVKWKDADASFLRQDLQQHFLCMTLDSFAMNKDADLARQRFNSLGLDLTKSPLLFDNLAIGGCHYNADDEVVRDLQAALSGLAPVMVETEAAQKPEEPQPTEDVAAELTTQPEGAAVVQPTIIPLSGTTNTAKKSGGSAVLLSLLCALFLMIGGALVYIFFIRNRRVFNNAPSDTEDDDYYEEDEEYEETPTARSPVVTPAPAYQTQHESDLDEMDYYAPSSGSRYEEEIIAPASVPKATVPAAAVAPGSGPVAHFMTTFVIGDDLYDDSFSIDAPNGSFLGECGVGISDSIGSGDPKKVTAFEVWLFDKNDIQTVTKVLMSTFAMADAGIKQRLASKGEPVLIEAGMPLLLETATLQLEAKVIEMVYGQGALPSGSFFQRMTLELSVWQK